MANSWQQNNWIKRDLQPVKNKDLWERLVNIQNRFKQKLITLEINHIPGHSGHPENEACDKLAHAAAKTNPSIIDEEYEKSKKG